MPKRKKLKKLPSLKIFSSLKKADKKSVLYKRYKRVLNSKFSKRFDQLKIDIQNHIDKCIYPTEELESEFKKALYSLQVRECKSHRNRKFISPNTLYFMKYDKDTLLSKTHDRYLKVDKLNALDEELYYKYLKTVTQPLSLNSLKILFKYHHIPKYTPHLENDIYFKRKLKYTNIKCCSCEKSVSIPYTYNVDIEELFCLDCEVDFEEGSKYLNELTESLKQRMSENISKIKDKYG